jgi:hypothetical protein
MKACMMASLQAGQMPDAAAFIKFGPSIGNATGALCDKDERAQAVIDMICTPGNPYVMFGMATIPLLAQLFRNHEPELHEAAERRKMRRKQPKAERVKVPPKSIVTIKIPFTKREWKVPIRFNASALFGQFRNQTSPPNDLAYAVFSDPKVQQALEKQGVYLRDERPGKV